MLKAALIAVLGLGFGSAAQAQATDDGTILGCQPSELESRPTNYTPGRFEREFAGVRYNFCPATGRSDNPLIETASDFLEGRRYNMSGTPSTRTVHTLLSLVPYDERLQETYISKVRELEARNYDVRDLGVVTDRRFRDLEFGAVPDV